MSGWVDGWVGEFTGGLMNECKLLDSDCVED